MLKWLTRTQFHTLNLLGVYFRAIVQGWHDILWGASLIALAFVLWWFLGNPPVWIIALYLTVVMFIAGYYAWRADHIRLMPKLELASLHMIYTRTNMPNQKRRYVQVLAKCATEGPLENCRGQLLRVLKWINNPDGKWEPTHVDETLDLLWSNVDQTSITLERGADMRLNVFFVENTSRNIVPCAGSMSVRMMRDCAPSDIFRFDVRVAAKDCPPRCISIKVTLGDQWDDLVLDKIDH